MLSGGLFGLLEFALLLIAAVVVAVTLVGGGVVAAVSLPALVALPTVRRHLVTLAENLTDERPESVADWRFVGAYFLFVYTYGMTLLLGSPMVAESVSTVERGVPGGRVQLLSILAVVALVGLPFGVRRAATAGHLRAVAEWAVFLFLVAGLELVAAFVVPALLFAVVESLLW